MGKIIRLWFALFFWVSIVAGQIPSGYYDAAIGKSGVQLQSALHDIIKGHTIVTYTPGVWSAFYTSDVKPNGTVWDMYSDIPNGTPNGNPPYVYHMGSDQCGTAVQEGDCYSREHSWPKSWFGDIAPMNTDLFHIYPTDQYVNGRRSNNPYGEVGSETWTSENGSKLGDCSTTGYSGVVFEPLDAYKGDLARTYFYMSTRYYGEDSGWPGSDMTNGAQLQAWALTMMIRWNSTDPVSAKETSRNEAVYQIQHNRNPFIDHPEYANLIWGNPSAIDDAAIRILSVFPNPVSDHCIVPLPFTGNVTAKDVSLYTMTGAKLDPVVSLTATGITLDLHGFPRGIYHLQVTDSPGGKYYHAKIVKE
jgi:endonuclease I